MIQETKRVKKVVIVAKETAYARAIREGDVRLRAMFRANHPSVHSLKETHRSHTSTLAHVLETVKASGWRARVVGVGRKFRTDDVALVMTVGGDGTFLWASHLVDEVPMLGVNGAPSTSRGFFCAATSRNFEQIWAHIAEGSTSWTRVARMTASSDGVQVCDRVLNEVLVAAASPAAMTRIAIRKNALASERRFRSSGVWVGPAAGSSAAMASAGGKVLPISSRALQWVVREPVGGPELSLARGLIKPGGSVSLRIESRNVRLFVDGGRKSLPAQMGETIRFFESAHPLFALLP